MKQYAESRDTRCGVRGLSYGAAFFVGDFSAAADNAVAVLLLVTSVLCALGAQAGRVLMFCAP